MLNVHQDWTEIIAKEGRVISAASVMPFINDQKPYTVNEKPYISDNICRLAYVANYDNYNKDGMIFTHDRITRITFSTFS